MPEGDRARAAIEALDRAREVAGWRPISEYPRDHDADAGTYWGPNALLFVPTGIVAPASDYRIITGRLEADMWLGWNIDGSMYDIDGAPSHWYSLPPRPGAAAPDEC